MLPYNLLMKTVCNAGHEKLWHFIYTDEVELYIPLEIYVTDFLTDMILVFINKIIIP